MIYIQGSTFQMGASKYDGRDDESPIHTVTVRDIYIGKLQVTVAEIRKFINDSKYKTTADDIGYGLQTIL